MQGIEKAARILFAGLLAIGILAIEAPAAEAAGYLKFEGVKGESTDKDHQDWIDVLSVRWDTQKPATSATGERVMRPRMGAGSVTITKRVDKASPVLMRRNSSGRHIDKVVIDATYGGARATYMKYELKDVRITSYTTAGADERMTETITLNYQKIRFIPSRMQRKPVRK